MTVHKLYCDSRARKEGTHADWVWQPDRPILVEKSRAFVDSVHLPVVWDTINEHNNFLYVAEELPLLTVMANQSKVYFKEGGTEFIAEIPQAMYDGPSLATALAQALTDAGNLTYTATHAASGTSESITISPSVTIASRATLVAAGTWAGLTLSKTGLQDASDVLGTVTADSSGTLNLGRAIAYRRIELATGSYNANDLASEIALQLNAGSGMQSEGTYTVTFNDRTGRLTITHSASILKFTIFSEDYLEQHPSEFQGYDAPYHGSDGITGFTGKTQGNSAVAEAYVNVMNYHTLFINSTLGSHNDSIGPVGQSTICRKIVIDSPPGGFVHDHHSLPFDYITLDKQSIAAIRFRLADWRGRTIPMPAAWSLSLIIVPEEQF